MNTRLASHRLWQPMPALALIFVMSVVPLPVSITVAQNAGGGAIEGKALDPQGGGISGATVTVTGPSGTSASVTTNEDGIFRLTQLKPGKYTVTVEGAQGFAKFEQANVEVNLSGPTNLTANLRVANVTETATPSGLSVLSTETMSNGTRGVDLALLQGLLKVILPDDIRAGDTISGTLVAEPKGATEAEKAKNAQTLKTFVIEIQGSQVGVGAGPFSFTVPSTETKPGEFSGKIDMRLLSPPNGNEVWKTSLPLTKTPENPPPLASTRGTTDAPASVGGREIYELPKLGQQGRFLQITGPFDGNGANTTLRFMPPGKENKENNFIVDGIDVSIPLKPLAESPRKMIFESPTTFAGPARLFVSDGGQTDTGPYNNVAVRLSAPKLNLLRGEKTTVTIEVSGLAGIIKDVPLQLDARGVINMDGGNFQNLRIKPEEVKLDGRYTTNRTINALQAGGFSVTATVIVGPFDICLQDDSDPDRRFRWNTFTGDYAFTDPDPPKPPGGTTTGSTAGSGTPPLTPPTGLNLTGIGKPAMKGCIITLSHNAPDRRVFARLDTCTKTGDAQVETKTPKATSEVTDKSTGNNSCPSSPK